MPHIINQACNRCGACLPACPTGSIVFSDWSQKFLIDTDTCADHRECVSVCPVDAIAPKGSENETQKTP